MWTRVKARWGTWVGNLLAGLFTAALIGFGAAAAAIGMGAAVLAWRWIQALLLLLILAR